MALTATTLGYLAVAASVASAGVAVYSSVEQAKDAKAAAKFNENQAEFNAEQQRNAATTAANDARQNALRTQEQHRKYLASLRTRMLEKSQTIEGGDRDFLNEATGDLQMRVLDASVASQRQQAGYHNNAFAYDNQAAGFEQMGKQAGTAGAISTAGAVLNGFGSVYQSGYKQGFWGMKDTPNTLN